MKGETSGKRIWKMTMLGIATQPERALLLHRFDVLPHCLHDAERPAEALPHQAIRGGRSFGVGQRAVFVVHPITGLQQRHREIGVFGHGVMVIASDVAHGRCSPCANRARNNADCIHRVQRAPLEVLAGDVFQRLPTRPQIHAVSDFGIAGNRADLGIAEVRHQLRNRVGRDDGVGIDAHEYLFGDLLQGEIERVGLARVRFGEQRHAASSNLVPECAACDFKRRVFRAVIDNDDPQILVIGVQHRAHRALDNLLFVVRRNQHSDSGLVTRIEDHACGDGSGRRSPARQSAPVARSSAHRRRRRRR